MEDKDKALAALRLTENILKCHRVMMRLHGKGFAEKIAPYIENVKLVMKAEKCDTFDALIKILEDPLIEGSDMATILYTAAAAEMTIEKKEEK